MRHAYGLVCGRIRVPVVTVESELGTQPLLQLLQITYALGNVGTEAAFGHLRSPSLSP